MNEDRVEEELRLIMNVDTLHPDDKLIALVQDMITSLQAWSAQFKPQKTPLKIKKLDITDTWLEQEIL